MTQMTGYAFNDLRRCLFDPANAASVGKAFSVWHINVPVARSTMYKELASSGGYGGGGSS